MPRYSWRGLVEMVQCERSMLGLGQRLGIGERRGFHVGVDNVRTLRPWRPASSCGRAKSRSPSRRGARCPARRPCWRCRGTAGLACSAHVVARVQPAQALVRGLQGVVVAGRHGNFVEPRGQIGEVDLHLRRSSLPCPRPSFRRRFCRPSGGRARIRPRWISCSAAMRHLHPWSRVRFFLVLLFRVSGCSSSGGRNGERRPG